MDLKKWSNQFTLDNLAKLIVSSRYHKDVCGRCNKAGWVQTYELRLGYTKLLITVCPHCGWGKFLHAQSY